MSIIGIWGEDKTCKSTLALSAPKPIRYMEFDIGGFERAVKNDTRYGYRDMVKSGDIVYEPYPLPVTASIGNIDFTKSTISVSKRVTGMKELFYKFLANYVKHLDNPKIATIIIDTATMLKQVTDDAYLQEKQEAQLDAKGNLLPGEKRLREQLTQIEYKEPNSRTRGIYYNAKSHGKHLMLVHHARDEYKPTTHYDTQGRLVTENLATGNRERAGFATLGDSADIIVHTYIEHEPMLDDKGKPAVDSKTKKALTTPVPYCTVELSEVLQMVGMNIRVPTFDMLMQMVEVMRG
jgi:hypothetical protein